MSDNEIKQDDMSDNQDGRATQEMPRYQCHKKVWAHKIAGIDGCTITPAEEGYLAFVVDIRYIERHSPQIGGYYVLYDDGYESYSPAEPFEDGYSPINSEPTVEAPLERERVNDDPNSKAPTENSPANTENAD